MNRTWGIAMNPRDVWTAVLICVVFVGATASVRAQEAPSSIESAAPVETAVTTDIDETDIDDMAEFDAEGGDSAEADLADGEVDVERPVLPPKDLSVWGMYQQADWVVKAVMLGLIFASIVTWTVLIAKTVEFAGVRRQLTKALSALQAVPSLADAEGAEKGIGRDLVDAALAEWRQSSGLSHKDGVKERVASRLSRIEAAAARRLSVGTGLLATIGATAPFVGLFGTVWGIMNSFIGIAESQTTNLAVVAPGIAEALLATALGLVAAIPAVVIYNHFTRVIGGLRALIGDQRAAVLRLVSRGLDCNMAAE